MSNLQAASEVVNHSKSTRTKTTAKTATMSIMTIYGKAGSGKSTQMAALIRNAKDYVVLAPTNAAVENIYRITCEGPIEAKRDRFKTLYSFFRIDYETETVMGAIYYPSTIFIDEFGLMPKHLFKACVMHAARGGVLNMVICGDVMQLSPIYENKQYISLNKLKRLNDGWNTFTKRMTESNVISSPSPVLYPTVIEHLHLSAFGLKCIQKSKLVPLTVNRRANDATKQILSAIYSENREFDYKFVEFFDLPKMIMKQNFVFIASKYKILQNVYDTIFEQYLKCQSGIVIINQNKISNKTCYKRLYLLPGMNVITCQTVKNEYINGQELIFTGNEESQGLKCIDPLTNQTIYIHKTKDNFDNVYYPITPSFLLSIHKSQGRSIEKVIVCIDDMFDISMLYTAITRTRNELIFYSRENISNRVNKLIEAAHVEEFKQLNSVVKNINIINNSQNVID